MKKIVLKTIEEYRKILGERNSSVPFFIFKFSPICGVSYMAEIEVDKWMEENRDKEGLVATVDVIYQRDVSRFISENLNVRHESPQFIFLSTEKEVKWVGNHYQISRSNLSKII